MSVRKCDGARVGVTKIVNLAHYWSAKCFLVELNSKGLGTTGLTSLCGFTQYAQVRFGTIRIHLKKQFI